MKFGIYGLRKVPKNQIFAQQYSDSKQHRQQTIEEQKQNSIFRDFSDAIYTGLQIRTSLLKKQTLEDVFLNIAKIMILLPLS